METKKLDIEIKEIADDLFTVYVNKQVVFEFLSKREIKALTISCILEQLTVE